jgi:hypothetical protein
MADIQELFGTSFLVVCDRRERFATNAAVPHDLRHGGLLVIDSIISALKEQNIPPFTLEKCFLADLAVTMTRAWEVYSIDELGKIKKLQSSIFQAESVD